MTISLTREGTTWDALLEQPGDIRLNEWLGTTGHREMVPNGHTAYPRGGILYPNYGPLPSPDYNTIVIPTGATRWSYGILLMSHTSTQQIITAAESSNLFTLTFSTIGKWVADDELAVERKLQLRVSVLRPYPITGRVQGPQAQLEAQTLWAVPIVDERFWWQHKYLNDVPDDLDGAQAVFDHVRVAAGGAGGVILLKPGGVTATLDDVYTQQPDISTMAGENAALVLEHICWHLGLSIAPDMLNPGKFHAIPMFSWTPGSSSTTVNADLIAANRQGNLLSPDTGGGWSETRQGYPAVMFGGALGDAPVLPATVKVQAAVGEWLEATNTTMAASGSEWQLRVTYTEATTQETADQLAEDTVARFTGGHNLVMCAVQNWQPTGCDDYVIHTQRRVNIEPHGDIGHIVSRVHPLSANVIPTLVESADNSLLAVLIDDLPSDPAIYDATGSITAGDAVVTTSQNLSAYDGFVVTIAGAGTAGANLTAIIISVTSSTITLSVTAGTSVTGATLVLIASADAWPIRRGVGGMWERIPDGEGDFVTITVVNPFQHIELEAGTLIGYERYNDEWHVSKADCEPGNWPWDY